MSAELPPEDYMSSPRPPAKKGWASTMTNAVKNNPVGVLSLVVILVLIIIYLYARTQGWFGLAAKPAGKTTREKGRTDEGVRSSSKKKRPPADDTDSETEDLIDSINNGPAA
jgi:hypothetical protein